MYIFVKNYEISIIYNILNNRFLLIYIVVINAIIPFLKWIMAQLKCALNLHLICIKKVRSSIKYGVFFF